MSATVTIVDATVEVTILNTTVIVEVPSNAVTVDIHTGDIQGTHIVNYNNPHAVTAAQAGALAIDGSNEMTGTINARAGSTVAGTAPFKFKVGDLLTVPEDGAFEFEDGHLYVTTGTLRTAISTSTGVKTSTNEVVNTTVETEIYRVVFPPNSLHADEVITAQGMAQYSNASASDDFTIRMKINGGLVYELPRVGGNKTDVGLEAVMSGTIRTVGAVGAFVSYAKMLDDDAVYLKSLPNESVIDTTVENIFTVTLQWDAAKAGNTFKAFQGYVQFLH